MKKVNTRRVNRLSIQIDFDWTPKSFWAILPAVNINVGSGALEFEWLCLGIYIFRTRLEEKMLEQIGLFDNLVESMALKKEE